MSSLTSLGVLAQWPVEHAAAAVVRADGAILGTYGPQDRSFRLASVTKPLTAYAVLVAVEEGALEWDQPAGPPGATVRHLAAHTSGLAFDSAAVQAQPGARRIYSNTGFEVLAETLEKSSGIGFPEYLHEAVFAPLGMTGSVLTGSAGAGAVSTCADLARFAAELQRPTLVSAATVAEATSVAFPGLNGVVPGYGMHKPCDWGLGVEIRGEKSPHWTGLRNSPRTYGHFGQAGTFLWVDPAAEVACVALADRDFGPWAVAAWTPFNDGVLAELGR
ncbi:serine hydrolase domain-containing protein [Crossiella sp. CA198]|uniref:serine hydrolase domain-containing protein n=1 Tax=Crossiella sp. CA198 TaxID=3455607 RepID=UPI003F8D622C